LKGTATHSLRYVVVVVFTMTVSPQPGAAAAQPAPAMLTGIVTAADGTRLPGVRLRVFHMESGTSVGAVSSDAGLFRIGNLTPGRYELEAEYAGFEPSRIGGIVLAGGASVSLNVRLEIASVHEHVRVVGEAQLDTVHVF
jgi:hypothetical protein